MFLQHLVTFHMLSLSNELIKENIIKYCYHELSLLSPVCHRLGPIGPFFNVEIAAVRGADRFDNGKTEGYGVKFHHRVEAY